MAGALAGIVVADFSRVLAGPYATMLLADMGATVIKVEHPVRGDDTRGWGPPFTSEGKATYFEGVNRNKKSIALDLKRPEDINRAKNLAAQSDIMVENFKVGTLDAIGLDYQSVKGTNPRIIYCSISGFGSGEGRALPGYDLLVQAMGGLMSITGQDEPTKVGVALVDILTGLHACIGILAALQARNLGGHGQLIEVNLLSSLLSSMVNQSSAFSMAGVVPQRLGNAHPSIAPYEVFETQDQLLVIAVGNDTQFQSLCGSLGLPDLAADPRFATNTDRVKNRATLKQLLTPALHENSAEHWSQLLTKNNVPSGPINDIAQAFELAHNLGLKPILNGHVSNPLLMSASPVDTPHDAPTLGQHTAEVIEQFGLDSK